MTIHRKNKKQYLIICALLALTAFFTAALSTAGLSGDPPRRIKFEIRLASYEKVDGWKSVAGPGPVKADIWISPQAALTNDDLARAWPQSDADGFSVGFLLTEEGSLKLACLTKSHVGEYIAVMMDGSVLSTPKIMAEITGGRAFIQGKINKEEEARSIAEGIMMK